MKFSAHKPRRFFLSSAFLYFLANMPISILLGFRYLAHAPESDSFLAQVFTYAALGGNFFYLYLVFWLLLIPVAVLFPFRKVFLLVLVPLVSVIHIITFADTAIFNLYRFHINGMVFNLLGNSAAWDSVKLGWATIATFTVICLVLVSVEYLVARGILNRNPKMPAIPALGSLKKGFLILMILSLVTDRGLFAYADMHHYTPITRQKTLYPLYMPITVKRLAVKFGYKIPEKPALDIAGGELNYPKEPITRPAEVKTPNILWIAIDCWRYDMLNNEVSPNLTAFSEKATWFSNHYSGGNASRFGVFSLFYGLYGSYWQSILGERRSTVLIDELQANGYQFKILSSTDLNFPEFRPTMFKNISADVEDTFPGETAAERDPAQTARFIQWLDERDTTKPFFSFLFLDAPHGREFPKEFELFKPNSKMANYMTLDKSDATAYRNSYKNAIAFNDDLVGQILRAVEQKGLMEDTVILITGDHGEEFYEHGYFGHTSAFTPEQTSVPLLLYVPGKAPEKVEHLTSHHDVVPTMFELMGYDVPPSTYSLGRSLFTDQPSEYAVSCGWDQCALIDSEGTLVFSTELYNAGLFDLFDSNYKLVNDNDMLNRKVSHLMGIAKQFGEFKVK